MNTLRQIEDGRPVTAKIDRRVRAAFRRHGVRMTISREGSATIVLGSPVGAVKLGSLPADLLGIPFLAIRPRGDGTWRVLFEVKAKDRPPGWPATRPLPYTSARHGNLNDPEEVKAIRRDAETLRRALQRAKGVSGQNGHA